MSNSTPKTMRTSTEVSIGFVNCNAFTKNGTTTQKSPYIVDEYLPCMNNSHGWSITVAYNNFVYCFKAFWQWGPCILRTKKKKHWPLRPTWMTVYWGKYYCILIYMWRLYYRTCCWNCQAYISGCIKSAEFANLDFAMLSFSSFIEALPFV
jgi:hypothetical protein